MDQTTAPNTTTTPTPAPTSASSSSSSSKKRQVNKTLVLVVGLIILTAVLLVITLTVKRSSLPSFSNDSASKMADIAHSTVTVSDDVRVASAAGTYQTDVILEPNGNKVTGIQLDLTYDPKVITVTDVAPGSFFSNPTVLDKTIDTQTGKITITIGTAFGSDPVTETGSVAVLTFKKVGEGNVVINVAPTTLVTDSRYSQSVLNTSVSADIEALPSGSTNSAAPTAVTSQ